MDIMGIVSLLETAILVGLLYTLFTVGLSLSFRVLNYPDITLEGSVILGGALCFIALHHGSDPITAILVGGIGGALAGLFTGIQHIYLGISKLLSGIITTAILYSINIRLLGGRANVRLEGGNNLFNLLNQFHNSYIDIAILASIVTLIILILTVLFSTRLGFVFRVLGDNESFVIALGHNPKLIMLLGLALSNAIIGVGGAILVQYKNTCDVNMSFGLLITALAAMVLGETIFSARKMWQYFTGSVLGTILYNLAIALVLFSWSSSWDRIIIASDVRLITGLLLIIPAILRKRGIERFRLFRSDW